MAKRKNKKQDERSAGFAFPVPLAVVLTLAAVLSLAYLWMDSRTAALRVRIQALEKQKKEIENRVINEQIKWSNMTSLPSIQRALQQHGVVMTWPQESRIVRIRRSPVEDRFEGGLEGRQLAFAAGARMHD